MLSCELREVYWLDLGLLGYFDEALRAGLVDFSAIQKPSSLCCFFFYYLFIFYFFGGVFVFFLFSHRVVLISCSCIVLVYFGLFYFCFYFILFFIFNFCLVGLLFFFFFCSACDLIISTEKAWSQIL